MVDIPLFAFSESSIGVRNMIEDEESRHSRQRGDGRNSAVGDTWRLDIRFHESLKLLTVAELVELMRV